MDDMNDSGIDHSPGDGEDYDENVDGDEAMEDEDDDYGGEFRQQKPRGGRGGFRRSGNRMDFGPRMGQGGPPHGPPPRFRGRGFGPRGPPPPGFRGHGPPPPFNSGPRGPRFRGGPPPPGYDPSWGPMPPGGMPPHPGGPPPHMMGPPGSGPPGMGPGGNNSGNSNQQGNGQQGGGPSGGGPPPGSQGGPNGPSSGGPPPQMNMPPPTLGGHPASGPPGSGPPPQLDLSGEVWVETKSGDGKSYYYNARTRETTWTKPEGNVKILLQEQVEAMAQAAGVVPNTGQTDDKGQPTQNGPTQQQMDMQQQPPPGMPPGMMQVGPPGGPGGPPGGPPMGMPPPGFGGPPPGYGGPPPFGMPPPGFPFPGGFPPPWATGPMGPQQPPTISAPPMSAVPHQMGHQEDPNLPQLDPEIVARAAEWTEHRAPDGRFYYYNAKAGESVWDKPQALKDLEAAKMAAAQSMLTGGGAQGNNAPTTSVTGTTVPPAGKPDDSTQTNPSAVSNDTGSSGTQNSEDDKNSNAPPGTQSTTNNGAAMEEDHSMSSNDGSKRKDDEKLVAAGTSPGSGSNVQGQQSSQQTQPSASSSNSASTNAPVSFGFPMDKSKPISSNPVPGTPWCVVWTGDAKVFFYNPSSRTSVWERPEELAGRADVDKLVSKLPDVLANIANNTNISAPQANSSSNEAGSKRESTGDVTSTPPSKKAKTDENVKAEVKEERTEKKAIDIGKEAAMEAEVRAARERAIVPLETRIKSFREMLTEKEVSAFSTWEKELHKIVFDPRYLLLTSKERKQVFEKYVKERAEEERREKRNKMKEKKEEFRRLMQDANLHGKSSFGDFAAKYAKDERFKNIEKMRERESLFNEYILEVRKREKEEKVQKRDQIKKDFMNLLKESDEVDRHSRWGDVKKKLDSDPRYKAVDSSSTREDWFREYIKHLKDERKREKDKKERDRERKSRDRGDRGDRDKRRDEEKENKPDKDNDDVEMKERGDGEEEEEEETQQEREAKEALEAQEKAARVEASLREREREVQKALAVHLRDRDTEREHHKHDEAVQHFNALLADLVRNCELGWREAKRQLRKDHRWELASLLDREEKEKLFNAHIEQLTQKKKEKFRELLNETPECTLSSSWKEVRKAIKDDPRYSKFSSSDRKCEREFKEYIKDKLVAAKTDLRELLQETKLITHKSNALVEENESHMREIEEMLEKDKRYLVLEHIADERRELLKSYLIELEKRGPPPPPTACDPARRPPIK
ncbi:hypothetical protein O3M35_006424 [Rhynocoris fuscipes]|uniref:Transcription elongation regulator 1 n=1 Tax=Rhynocoris fuscipes TaxID=488301 RepID=A0AAW1DDP2_9HEMI